MIALAKQVVSLSLAKRLKELGVKQESYFTWYLIPTNGKDGEVATTTLGRNTNPMRRYANDWVSAFTVAELGELLPPFFKHPLYGYINVKTSWDESPYWTVEYWERSEAAFGQGSRVSEAEARGLMLAHLIEEKLVGV